jgi:hypothetical protein
MLFSTRNSALLPHTALTTMPCVSMHASAQPLPERLVEPLHFRQGTGDQGAIPLLDQGLLVPRDGIEDPPVRRGQPQLRDRSQERITPSGTSPTGRFPPRRSASAPIEPAFRMPLQIHPSCSLLHSANNKPVFFKGWLVSIQPRPGQSPKILKQENKPMIFMCFYKRRIPVGRHTDCYGLITLIGRRISRQKGVPH